MTDRELRAALRHASEVDPAARERSWRVVRSAYAASARAPRRRPWAAVVVATVVLALAAVGGAAATAPRTDIGRWVRSVLGVGEPHARRALVHVPGGGAVLVQADGGAWVIRGAGAKRRLGSYAGASWSPHGSYVVAWRRGLLTALDPRGRPRWSIARPQPIAGASWGPVDGFRIAYLSAGELRIVNGDGTGDHRVAAARDGVMAAWRPDATHVVAFANPAGRVAVMAVDGHRLLWRSRRLPALLGLAWSPGGERLLALGRRRLFLFDAAGRLRAQRRLPRGFVVQGGAWAPRGDDIALVRRSRPLARTELVLLDAARGLRERLLFTGPGVLGAAQWSPDARWLLLPWPAADQWLFLRPAQRGAKIVAFANIAAQFAPGAERPGFPSAVAWCCRVAPRASR